MNWLKLCSSRQDLSQRQLAFRARHPLINAELKINWKTSELNEQKFLISTGQVLFKLPFQEQKEFTFSGRDFLDPQKKVQLDEFDFKGGARYFGRWHSDQEQAKIFYKDQRKDHTFELESDIVEGPSDGPSFMGPIAVLFCFLQTQASQSSGIFIGADKLYHLSFVRQNANADPQIQIFQAKFDHRSIATEAIKPSEKEPAEPIDKTKHVASLFLNPSQTDIVGGEIILKLFGKVRFDSVPAQSV